METQELQEVQRGPITEMQLKVLMAGLNPDRVAHREQGRKTMSYLEQWDVRATLIRVFGFGGFSAEAHDAQIVHMENDVPKVEWGQERGQKVTRPVERNEDGTVKFGTANFRVTAMVGMKLTIHQTGAVYDEYAVSSQTGPDVGEVADFAIKTAESDALKRACTNLGTQYGLSLYDDGSTKDVVKKVFAPGQEWPRPPKEGEQEKQEGPKVLPAGNGVTAEQHAAGEALVQRALSMQATRDAEQAAEYERQQAEIDATAPNQ